MYDFKPQRVRLRYGLTDYDERLVVGSLGYTTGRDGQFGEMINYDCGAYRDTLWKGLEIVDKKCPGPDDHEGYLRWKAARLSKATKVHVDVGPMGGFRSLTYKIGKQEIALYEKCWAEPELDQLLAAGKKITETWPDGTKTDRNVPKRYRSPLREAWERHDEAQRKAAEAAAQEGPTQPVAEAQPSGSG